MPFWLVAAALADDPRVAYAVGLAAWRKGKPRAALQWADAALASDPTMPEAQLLRGFALLRTGEVRAGLDALALVDDADDPEIASRAHRVSERWLSRRRRDEPAFSLGQSVLAGATYGNPAPRIAWIAEGQVPIRGPLLVRASVATPWGPVDELDVVGPRVGVLADVQIPLGEGVWRVDAAVGPSVWVAAGDYWPSGLSPFVGGRASAGIDLRATRRVGFRVEGGASWYPAADRALPFYSQVADARAILTLYPTP
jgi:hypothetical protein